ncbi:MAG: hypothetical protein ACQESG_02175 [Nanobdellota archaeon]
MKPSALFGLLLGVAVLVILATYFGYTYLYQADVQTLDIHIRVDDYLGMNTDTDRLWFGTISPGSHGKRYVNVTNPKDYPVVVDFSVKGDVSGWIRISDNGFALQPNGSKKLRVFAQVPKTASFGNYTGTLYVTFHRD